MGGFLHSPRAGYPQWTYQYDYNVQSDPEAAQLVINKCAPAIVPLEVTAEVFLRAADLPRLEAAGALGKLLARQGAAHGADYHMQKMAAQFSALPQDLLNFHYDPLTCAAAVGWEGVKFEEIPIKTELRDGLLRLSVDPSGRHLKVATSVDGDRFNRVWLDVLTSTKNARG
jgi:purine nucleosidase